MKNLKNPTSNSGGSLIKVVVAPTSTGSVPHMVSVLTSLPWADDPWSRPVSSDSDWPTNMARTGKVTGWAPTPLAARMDSISSTWAGRRRDILGCW